MSNFDGPILAGSDLAKALNKDIVPDLPSGFADRVIARTEGRSEPLPAARISLMAGPWTRARRLTVGVFAAGALASAAAATGVLQQLPVTLPSAEAVWATIAGEPEPEPAAVDLSPVETVMEGRAVTIEGPIDTPEELEEAFTRIDRVRETRTEIRRSKLDQRISQEIDRRREQGLRAPNEQQEQLLRGLIEQRRELRDSQIDQMSDERRDALRERLEAGEALTREDIVPPGLRGDDEGRLIRDRLRQLRKLPPEQRRAVIRRVRERQQQNAERSSPDATQTDAVEPGAASDTPESHSEGLPPE